MSQRLPIRMRPAAVARWAALAALVLGVFVGGPASAQTAGADTIDVNAVDATGYPTVDATVTLSPELADAPATARTFTVKENGQDRPAAATRLRGNELEVVLLIDTSGSMSRGALDAAKDAAQAFVERLPEKARVAVVGFGDHPELATPLTADRAVLETAIGNLQAFGETALFDAVDMALTQVPPEDGTRRQIVVLSDGKDTVRADARDEVLARLQANGAGLSAVELVGSEGDHDTLVALTDGRGSLASATAPGALTSIFDDLGRGLANQFDVQYQSGAGGTAQVEISVLLDGALAATATTAIEMPVAAGAPEPTGAGCGAAVVESQVVETGWLDGTAALVVGVGCCVAALLLLVSMWVLREPQRRARLGPAMVTTSPQTVVTSVVQQAAAFADRALERQGRRGWLDVNLERAGIALKPGEVVIMSVAAFVITAVVVTLLLGWIIGLALAVIAGATPFIVVSTLARRRQSLFADQLGDNLVLMAGTLRTGYAILPALDLVSKEAPSPSAEEFRRVVTESRLGRDLNTSLAAMADRVGGEDFTWVAQAIEINREVGGDLAEVLDNVSSTIRERARVRRQVRTVSAEGRMSAVVLVSLPLVLGAVLAIINPTYVSELTHGAGLVMLGVGAVLLVIGSVWTRRLVKVEF